MNWLKRVWAGIKRIPNLDLHLRALQVDTKQDNARLLRLESLVLVGADIAASQRGASWAVICIHGKQDFVQFMDLSGRDAEEIRRLLRNFEPSNRCVDAPLHLREMFR